MRDKTYRTYKSILATLETIGDLQLTDDVTDAIESVVLSFDDDQDGAEIICNIFDEYFTNYMARCCDEDTSF